MIANPESPVRNSPLPWLKLRCAPRQLGWTTLCLVPMQRQASGQIQAVRRTRPADSTDFSEVRRGSYRCTVVSNGKFMKTFERETGIELATTAWKVGIRRRCEALVTVALVILGTPLASTHLAAQWLKYPTAGVPRKADGKVDMSGPSPRMANGKPDFSGIWTTGEPNSRRAEGLTSPLSSPKEAPGPREPQSSTYGQSPGDPTAITASRQMANIGVDLPGGLPYQPWLVPIVRERTDNLAKDDPHIRCWPDNFIRAYGMPHLLKFVHSPNLLVMLNEMNAGYRQVFTDARPLPEDPNPSLQGYSSGKWSGDTLVIDTIGVRDDTWIDWNGSVLTQAAKVREQIRRPDFGHLEIQVTVDDPRAYTKPWTVNLKAAHRCRHRVDRRGLCGE